jgi:hypothetical protein
MRGFALALSVLLLAGCMDDPQPPPTERQPTVLDDQLKAIDRAKAVEHDVLDEKARQDAEIEAQGG